MRVLERDVAGELSSRKAARREKIFAVAKNFGENVLH
jgi:hypothetical protein